MKKIHVTDVQKALCHKYLQGVSCNSTMYTLYMTYMQEYMDVFGFESIQKDSIDIILNNFCGAAINT